MINYSFGVPAILIWLSHIIFGIYFLWLGYSMVCDPKYKLHGSVILIVGALMFTYHGHIWLYNIFK